MTLTVFTLVGAGFAQSTKPSPPEFTAQAPNASTVELIIKNQPFTNSDSVNALVYEYAVRNYGSELWIRHGGIGDLQSTSNTTTITIKTPYPSDYPFTQGMRNIINSSVLDFQVRAITGYYTVVPIQGGADIYFNASETSDWSSAQTVNLTQPSSSYSTATMQPTAQPSPTPNSATPPTTVEAKLDNGTNVSLALNGNITSKQMSNITIVCNEPEITTAITFTLTGETGTMGLGNLTIPKTAIRYGNTPLIYINSEQAENQGYSQDANNYYVWYTTHFSTHKISIIFNQSSVPEFTTLSAGVFLIISTVASTILVLVMKPRHEQN